MSMCSALWCDATRSGALHDASAYRAFHPQLPNHNCLTSHRLAAEVATSFPRAGTFVEHCISSLQRGSDMTPHAKGVQAIRTLYVVVRARRG